MSVRCHQCVPSFFNADGGVLPGRVAYYTILRFVSHEKYRHIEQQPRRRQTTTTTTDDDDKLARQITCRRR